MISPRTKRLAFFVLSAAVLLILAVGCSKSPLESTEAAPETKVLGRSAAALAASFSPGDGTDLYKEQVISAATGGRMEFYDVIIEVPPGAIDVDTTFSVLIPDLSVFYNEFGTHGLVFNTPVRVTMSYRDADLTNVLEETIRIAYFNAETGAFEDVVCRLDMVNKVVIAELSHFSAYGLISDYVINPFKS